MPVPSGTLTSDSQGKAELWKNYYINLLNRNPVPSSNELIDAAANATLVTTISCDPPSDAEIQRSIAKMKSGRAAGICGISAKLLKAGGECIASRLTLVIQQAWEGGTAPDDWKKGIILPFIKQGCQVRMQELPRHYPPLDPVEGLCTHRAFKS